MASQQQQARPMFRFATMLRPAGAPQPPPAAAAPAAPAPQPMFRPPVAAPFRPPQTRDPSPPPRPPTAPAPPPPTAPPPAAPAPRSPAPTVLAPPLAQRDPVVQPRFTVAAPPPPAPADPRPAATIPSAPKSPATRPSAAIPVAQDSKPATSSRSPPPSPRNLEPAMKEPNQYSPNVKPVSPLKLPPAVQFKSEAEVEPRIPAEIDQKTVVVQERAERNKVTAQKFNTTQRYSTSETDWSGKRESMMTKDKDNIHHKKRSDNEEPLGMSILTLAGENKGAMMELSPARANKQGFNGNPRRLKEWSDGEKSGKESDEEGKSRMGEKNNNSKGMESLPMTAFMNSNVQGVNNSILHNASCTHHDPGVHLVFSRKGGRYTKEAQRLKD